MVAEVAGPLHTALAAACASASLPPCNHLSALKVRCPVGKGTMMPLCF